MCFRFGLFRFTNHAKTRVVRDRLFILRPLIDRKDGAPSFDFSLALFVRHPSGDTSTPPARSGSRKSSIVHFFTTGGLSSLVGVSAKAEGERREQRQARRPERSGRDAWSDGHFQEKYAGLSVRKRGDSCVRSRVLSTTKNYERAYGKNGKLPELLRTLFGSRRPLLFLGCSLLTDRTLIELKKLGYIKVLPIILRYLNTQTRWPSVKNDIMN